MILPWVSREVVTLLKENVAQLTERLARADERYADLLDRYHALKASGAVTPMEPKPRELDPVTQAVIAKARGNPVLYQHYGTFVATQRALGASEDGIAQQILHGIDDDAGIPL